MPSRSTSCFYKESASRSLHTHAFALSPVPLSIIYNAIMEILSCTSLYRSPSTGEHSGNIGNPAPSLSRRKPGPIELPTRSFTRTHHRRKNSGTFRALREHGSRLAPGQRGRTGLHPSAPEQRGNQPSVPPSLYRKAGSALRSAGQALSNQKVSSRTTS
jgi:hypothetical protein